MIRSILVFLFAFDLVGGITFKGQKPVETQPKPAAEKEVRAEVFGNLSAVNLRVEGASFRRFNLFFPPSVNEGLGKEKSWFTDIRAIVDRDLAIVGAFDFVKAGGLSKAADALIKQKGAEGVTRLSLSAVQNDIKATVEHKNLVTGKTTLKSFQDKFTNLRRLSHTIAQSIYEEFVGPENLFQLQFVAVKREKSGDSLLVMMDFDGQNETVIADGKWLKSCPTFSPDGKNVLYTVTSPQGQGVVEQVIGSKRFEFRIRKPGLNIDPRVLPDNSGILVTLSFENNYNIYRATRLGTLIGPVTQGLGLNLSPSISPDGKEIAFVSDRSGSPQIYVQNLGDNKAKRVSFKGNYNQTPQFCPTNKDLIAFTGRDERRVFDIFVLDRKSERISRVTQEQGRNQEPNFTPSGRFLIFTSEREGKSKPDIFLATLNGSHQYRLTNAHANAKTLGYSSPAVKPKP